MERQHISAYNNNNINLLIIITKPPPIHMVHYSSVVKNKLMDKNIYIFFLTVL